jgi:ribonuclease HI
MRYLSNNRDTNSYRVDKTSTLKDLITTEPIKVYTDGACSGNPGPGGWGVVFVSGKGHLEMNGHENNTTNNRMEMMAVISALSYIKEQSPGSSVILYTDSKYVKDGITTWIKKWHVNNWQTAARQPVKNKDLWMRLDELSLALTINWEWIKGHAGDNYNGMADTLARNAITV